MTAQEFYNAFCDYLTEKGYDFGINPNDEDPTAYIIVGKTHNGIQTTNLDRILLGFKFKPYINGETLLIVTSVLCKVNIDTFENFSKAVARVNRINSEDAFMDYYYLYGDQVYCSVITYLPDLDAAIRQFNDLYKNCTDGFYMDKFKEFM